jgi:hypothetical protein
MVIITYLHLGESYTASFHTATMGAWSLQVPIENYQLVILWLISISALSADFENSKCTSLYAFLKTYQFDSNLFIIFDVSAVVDVSECPTSEFAAETVFSSYS